MSSFNWSQFSPGTLMAKISPINFVVFTKATLILKCLSKYSCCCYLLNMHMSPTDYFVVVRWEKNLRTWPILALGKHGKVYTNSSSSSGLNQDSWIFNNSPNHSTTTLLGLVRSKTSNYLAAYKTYKFKMIIWIYIAIYIRQTLILKSLW